MVRLVHVLEQHPSRALVYEVVCLPQAKQVLQLAKQLRVAIVLLQHALVLLHYAEAFFKLARELRLHGYAELFFCLRCDYHLRVVEHWPHGRARQILDISLLVALHRLVGWG